MNKFALIAAWMIASAAVAGAPTSSPPAFNAASPPAIGNTTPNTGAFTALTGTTVRATSAGAAATPSFEVGNATTGLYSVSTTGLGASVNAVSVWDFGVTHSNALTASAAAGFYAPNGLLAGNSDIGLGWTAGALSLRSSWRLVWDSGDGTGGTIDTGLSRDSANVIDVGNGTQGDKSGRLNLTTLVALGDITGGNAGNSFFTLQSDTATIRLGVAADAKIARRAAANFSLGGFDAPAPVAQTLSVQSVVAGTSNTAGALFNLVGSLSTGSGVSGDICFQTGGTGAAATVQNTATTAFCIKGATGALRNPTIAADTAQTDTAVCQDTTNHQFYSGTGTLGVCLGTSSRRYKRWETIKPLTDGLDQILALKPVNYFYNNTHGDRGAREQYGLIAEDVVSVLPKLTHLDATGQPNSVDLVGMIPVLIKAVQEEQAEIKALKARVYRLEHHVGTRH